jgi:hypothetical protein
MNTNYLSIIAGFSPTVKALGLVGFGSFVLWLSLAALVGRSHRVRVYRDHALNDWRD